MDHRLFLYAVLSDLEVYGGGAFVILTELIILAGQDRVEHDTDDRSDRQAGEGDYTELDAADGVIDTDGENQNERCNDDVAGICKVDLVLNDIADADRRDHTVEDE